MDRRVPVFLDWAWESSLLPRGARLCPACNRQPPAPTESGSSEVRLRWKFRCPSVSVGTSSYQASSPILPCQRTSSRVSAIVATLDAARDDPPPCPSRPKLFGSAHDISRAP